MPKDLIYEEEARKSLLAGAEKLSRTVAVTMGPQGKNVILGKPAGAPILTKDGVTVAREINLAHPVEELACRLIKEAAGRTAEIAGDGTTTATVLSHEIFKRGCELIDSSYSPLDFKRGLEWAVKEVVGNLNNMSTEIAGFEDLRGIATISANNDADLGDKIARAFQAVGLEGTVVAEACPGLDNSVRFVDGIELASGYITPAFLTELGQAEIAIDRCNILICNDDISNLSVCLGLLTELSDKDMPILILARSVKQEVLSTLVANNRLGRLKAVAVKIPRLGALQDEWLDALSVIVGTKVFSEEGGTPLSSACVSDLGFAKKVVVNKYITKILEGRSDPERMKNKVALYEEDLKSLIGDSIRADVKRRMAFLQSRAAIVSVGYSTELELREKGDRVDDAICATRAAIEEGYVPGGGTALLRAAARVDLSTLDKRLVPAARVLLDACARPITQIVTNAYQDAGEVISRVLESKDVNFGYNAATGKYEDIVKAGVIDPKKVTRIALQNAASISMLLINTDAVVSEQADNPSSWQPPPTWRLPEDGRLNHKH